MVNLREGRGTALILGLATVGTIVGATGHADASLPSGGQGLAVRVPAGSLGPLPDGPARLLLGAPKPGDGPVQCRATAPRAAIAEVRSAYMEAFNAGRTEDVAALHTEDVISMPAGMPAVEGRAALLEHMTASFAAAPEGFRFTFHATELRVADGWAVERGVTDGYVEGAEVPIPAGKYVLLYERGSDGCWRIAWSITNSDQDLGP